MSEPKVLMSEPKVPMSEPKVLMSEPKVLMYTTSWCPYCLRARRLLEDKGVSFTEIDVEAVPAARAQMVERSGGRATVPQIFIGDTHVGGADELDALEAAGRLDELLEVRSHRS